MKAPGVLSSPQQGWPWARGAVRCRSHGRIQLRLCCTQLVGVVWVFMERHEVSMETGFIARIKAASSNLFLFNK